MSGCQVQHMTPEFHETNQCLTAATVTGHSYWVNYFCKGFGMNIMINSYHNGTFSTLTKLYIHCVLP